MSINLSYTIECLTDNKRQALFNFESDEGKMVLCNILKDFECKVHDLKYRSKHNTTVVCFVVEGLKFPEKDWNIEFCVEFTSQAHRDFAIYIFEEQIKNISNLEHNLELEYSK